MKNDALAPHLNITLKPHGHAQAPMGLRGWWRRRGRKPSTQASEEMNEEAKDEVSFASVRLEFENEAQRLFEEDEPDSTTPKIAPTPYDASESDLDVLFSDDKDENFTHRDEIEIVDVSALDDPYMTAAVEGDLPQPVEFEGS